MEALSNVSRVVTRYGIPAALVAGGLYVADDFGSMLLRKYKWPIVIGGGLVIGYMVSTSKTGDIFAFPRP